MASSSFPGTTKFLCVSSCAGLALDLGQDLSLNEQDIPHPTESGRLVHRFGLRRPVVDVWPTALPRADFDWLRNRAGGRLNSRLKARLKDGSDS